MNLYKKLRISYENVLKKEMQEAFTYFLQGKLRTKQNLNMIRTKTYHELEPNDLPIYSHVEVDIFLKHIPTFKRFLTDYNLEIKLITMLAILDNMNIHCDLSQDYTSYIEYYKNPPPINSAIIFPVFNTEQSITTYYRPKYDYDYYTGIKGKVLEFNTADMEIMDQFTVNGIYALRVDIPHGVIKNDNKPRVVYSVKFTTNIDI
jgi:hypothetical protein